MARVKQFFNNLTMAISGAGMARANRAAERIRHFGVALDSNKKIKRAENIVGSQWRKGAREGIGTFFANRRAEIVAGRTRTVGDSLDELDATSQWFTKNGWKQNAASLFYSGETGKISKGRIAGVAAGLGFGAYHTLSSDDDD